MDSSLRIKKIREKMAAEGVKVFLITHSSYVDYATGFDGIHDEEDPHAVIISQIRRSF